MRHELNLRRTKIFDMGYEKISRLDLSNFSDICDALKLCRDPTSPVEIELLFTPVELEILNGQPTDKRSFLGGNQKRLRFFTPQRGRIETLLFLSFFLESGKFREITSKSSFLQEEQAFLQI